MAVGKAMWGWLYSSFNGQTQGLPLMDTREKTEGALGVGKEGSRVLSLLALSNHKGG